MSVLTLVKHTSPTVMHTINDNHNTQQTTIHNNTNCDSSCLNIALLSYMRM